LEIETTRDIARQILRHRSFSFQEFSQRYADPVKELEFVLREARLQDEKNRQNSVKTDNFPLIYEWNARQKDIIELVKVHYKWAINNGIAKEQARAILPEGLTMSRLYMSGTLRSWIHYIQLRSGNGTQLEHMEIAKECAKVIAEVFPLSTQFIATE
jgi:thymidylate synthase (FAD)